MRTQKPKNKLKALIVNDLHGIESRNEALFQAVRENQDVEFIILNGDIFGGEKLGKLQQLFCNVRNPLKNGDERAMLEALLPFSQFITEDLGILESSFSQQFLLKLVNDCYHYGVFVSYLCEISLSLRDTLEREILNSIYTFFRKLTALKGDKTVIVLNTGNWEEVTPLDFDPSDITLKIKKPIKDCISNKLVQICNEFKIIYNDEDFFIEKTMIIGATVSRNKPSRIGFFPEKIICHFPLDTDNRQISDWMEAAHCSELYHGHIHDGSLNYTSQISRKVIFCHQIGAGQHLIITL